MEKKAGRNDPCPCGSGKKYKNCCMGKEAESKKTYTQTGKRKFKASVISLQDKTQSIFSASAAAPAGEVPKPSYVFLKFKQAPVNYQMQATPADIPFSIPWSTSTDFPMPSPVPDTSVVAPPDTSVVAPPDTSVVAPNVYTITSIDYRILS